MGHVCDNIWGILSTVDSYPWGICDAVFKEIVWCSQFWLLHLILILDTAFIMTSLCIKFQSFFANAMLSLFADHFNRLTPQNPLQKKTIVIKSSILFCRATQCNALQVIILIMVICWVKITNGGIKLIPARNLVCTQRIRGVSS